MEVANGPPTAMFAARHKIQIACDVFQKLFAANPLHRPVKRMLRIVAFIEAFRRRHIDETRIIRIFAQIRRNRLLCRLHPQRGAAFHVLFLLVERQPRLHPFAVRKLRAIFRNATAIILDLSAVLQRHDIRVIVVTSCQITHIVHGLHHGGVRRAVDQQFLDALRIGLAGEIVQIAAPDVRGADQLVNIRIHLRLFVQTDQIAFLTIDVPPTLREFHITACVDEMETVFAAFTAEHAARTRPPDQLRNMRHRIVGLHAVHLDCRIVGMIQYQRIATPFRTIHDADERNVQLMPFQRSFQKWLLIKRIDMAVRIIRHDQRRVRRRQNEAVARHGVLFHLRAVQGVAADKRFGEMQFVAVFNPAADDAFRLFRQAFLPARADRAFP